MAIIDLSSILLLKNPLKSRFLDLSRIIFKSASSALLIANFTPLASISSLESLIPAVSEIIIGISRYI